MAIWSCDRILEFEDDLTELKADRVVKSKHRLTCLAVQTLEHKGKSEKKKESLLGKRGKD
jgi:hypothetical protein